MALVGRDGSICRAATDCRTPTIYFGVTARNGDLSTLAAVQHDKTQALTESAIAEYGGVQTVDVRKSPNPERTPLMSPRDESNLEPIPSSSNPNPPPPLPTRHRASAAMPARFAARR